MYIFMYIISPISYVQVCFTSYIDQVKQDKQHTQSG